MHRSLVPAACALLCLSAPALAQDVPFESVSQGQLAANAAPARAVIKNAGELQDSAFAEIVPLNAVDFSREVLLGVIQDNPSGAVFDISIAKVSLGARPGGGRRLEIELAQRGVAAGGGVQSKPYHLVKLSARHANLPVAFTMLSSVPTNPTAPVVQPQGLAFSVWASGDQAPASLPSGYYAVRTPQGLRDLGLTGSSFSNPIDFFREQLLVAVLDTKPRADYGVHFESVSQRGSGVLGGLSATVRLTVPDPSSPGAALQVRPFQIIKVRATGLGGVRFRTNVISTASYNRIKGRVQVDSSLGIRIVRVEVAGKLRHVRPPAVAATLAGLAGREVELEGTLSSSRVEVTSIASPLAYSARGQVRPTAAGLRFVDDQGRQSQPEGGLVPLLETKEFQGGWLEVRGWRYPQPQRLVVTGVQAEVRQNAQLTRAGQVVGYVSRGEKIHISAPGIGTRLLVESSQGVKGQLSRSALEWLERDPLSVTVGGITIRLGTIRNP
ncbi:MAG TPA: hypothetical protein DEA08_34360 [Planctomycetes bacterium]|nr:hypothetical protein [Planctomycetota bacterium]